MKPVFCEFRSLYDYHVLRGAIGGVSPEGFYRELLAGQRQRVPTSELVAQGDLYDAGCETEWFSLRKPPYRVYPDMALALASSRLEVPTEELELPFPAFCVSLPARALPLAPETIHPATRERICGAPHLRAILVGEAELSTLEGRPGAFRCLSLRLDIGDERPDSAHFGRIDLMLPVGKPVARGVESVMRDTESPDYQPSGQERMRLAALAAGVAFLAISRDRRYVERVRLRPRPADPCLCGSGARFKRCCSLTKTDLGRPIGFEVGRAIRIPYRAASASRIVTSEGRQLEYGHVRSGHMRWQPCLDEDGQPTRKLIFVLPTVVRPDLPLKPRLTPHEVHSSRL